MMGSWGIEVIYFPKQRLIILSMLLLARRRPNSRQVQAPFPAASGHRPHSPVSRPRPGRTPACSEPVASSMKENPPLCSCRLSPEISPIHPNHDIKFPAWPRGAGKFQGDINTTWKIAARRKTVLDLSSDTTRKSLFFLTGAWQLRRLRIQASICSGCLRWDHWSCKALDLGIQLSYSPPPTLSR